MFQARRVKKIEKGKHTEVQTHENRCNDLVVFLLSFMLLMADVILLILYFELIVLLVYFFDQNSLYMLCS